MTASMTFSRCVLLPDYNSPQNTKKQVNGATKIKQATKVIYLGLVVLVCFFFGDGFAHADTIYVGDRSTSAIRTIDAFGNASFFAGTDSYPPHDLALDASGNLYAAFDSNVINKYNALGNASVFANTGLNGVDALAFDASGNLYAANLGGGAGLGNIVKYNSQGSPSIFAYTGAIQPAGGMAFDNNGNLYAALEGNSTIEKYDSQGNASLFASRIGSAAMTFYGGNLYVATVSDAIYKFDLQGQATLFANSGLSGVGGLAFDGSGNLYAVNQFNNTITKFDPQGNASIFAESFSIQGIAIQPVPEPTTWSLLALGAVALLGGRQVRRRPS